jgi:multiple sugar transport system permease protein
VTGTAQTGSEGGPNNATLFLVLYLYKKAFQEFRMGYASALAWILFFIILVFTVLQTRLSKNRVHYEAGA